MHERISVSNPVSVTVSRSLDIALPDITVSKFNTSQSLSEPLSNPIVVYANRLQSQSQQQSDSFDVQTINPTLLNNITPSLLMQLGVSQEPLSDFSLFTRQARPSNPPLRE